MPRGGHRRRGEAPRIALFTKVCGPFSSSFNPLPSHLHLGPTESVGKCRTQHFVDAAATQAIMLLAVRKLPRRLSYYY